MKSEYKKINIEDAVVDNIGSVMAVIPFHDIASKISILRKEYKPKAGDVLLARVSKNVTKTYLAVQNYYGRTVWLYPGDIIIVTIGTRESTTHIVGLAPERALSPNDTVSLLSEGGVVGDITYIPPSMGQPNTVDIIGFLQYQGKVMNMLDFAPEATTPLSLNLPPVILVTGTSSEIGKTTTTARMINFLTKKYHLSVSSVMMTGIGSKADALNHLAGGSLNMHSFIETGYPSTCDKIADSDFLKRIESLFYRIAQEEKPDVIVGELGGDFTSLKNDVILQKSRIMNSTRAIVVAAGDIVAAIGTKFIFDSWKIKVPYYFANSWLRSYGGMKLRYKKMLNTLVYDVMDISSLELLADELYSKIHETK